MYVQFLLSLETLSPERERDAPQRRPPLMRKSAQLRGPSAPAPSPSTWEPLVWAASSSASFVGFLGPCARGLVCLLALGSFCAAVVPFPGGLVFSGCRVRGGGSRFGVPCVALGCPALPSVLLSLSAVFCAWLLCPWLSCPSFPCASRPPLLPSLSLSGCSDWCSLTSLARCSLGPI